MLRIPINLKRNGSRNLQKYIQMNNKYEKRLKLTNNEGTVKKNQRKMRKNLTHMAGNTF